MLCGFLTGGSYKTNQFSELLVLFNEFSSDWSYKSRARLEILEKIGKFDKQNWNFRLKCVKNPNFRLIGLIATHVSDLITTPCKLQMAFITYNEQALLPIVTLENGLIWPERPKVFFQNWGLSPFGVFP